MATETVDIIFRQTGGRTIVRTLDDIGIAANRVTRGLYLLQRAFFVLGGLGLGRLFQQQLDTLTNYENRLRLTTASTENMERVQRELFDIANRSRTAFASTAEVYARAALSARNLGIGQEELLRFTESLNKAAIVSGASGREANAALVQLGQGLAANRLGGDELRSIVEQLPFVAQVLEKHLGVGRNELRKMGMEGKLTADIILEAFRVAAPEIDELFARTTPTIEQSFTVLHNKILEFIDDFDDATGLSEKFARVMLIVANNLYVVAGAIGVASAAVSTIFARNAIVGATSAFFGYIGALREGVVASNRFVEVERLRAAGNQRRRAADLADIISLKNSYHAAMDLLQVQRQLFEQQKRNVAFTVSNGRARNVQTGQFVKLADAARNYKLILADIASNEAAYLATSAAMNAQTARAQAAMTALTAANARLGVAIANSSGLLARFTRTFPTLTTVVLVARNALVGLFTILFANPITAIVTAIAAAGAALVLWGNNVKVTEDNIVGLRDTVFASFQLIWETVSSVFGQIAEAAAPVTGYITNAFELMWEYLLAGGLRFLEGYKTVTNVLIGLWVGAYRAVIEVWNLFPDDMKGIGNMAAGLFLAAINRLVNGTIQRFNILIKGLNLARGLAGLDPVAEIEEINLGEMAGLEGKYADVGARLGDAVQKGFTESLGRDYLGEFWNASIERARQNIANRPEKEGELLPGQPGMVPGGVDEEGRRRRKKKPPPTFKEVYDELNREIEATKRSNREREIYNGLLEIERKIKRDLTPVEAALARERLMALQSAEDQVRLLEEIKGPMLDYQFDMEALNTLFKEGRINVDEYSNALRELQIQFLDEQTDFRSGVDRSFLKMSSELEDMATDIEFAITGAFRGAEDALVDFVTTGKADFRGFVTSIIADLNRLIIRQAIIRPLVSNIGNILGIPGMAGGFPGGMTSVPGGVQFDFGLPSAAGGGYTGNASRSGGLDGHGGFLAMLHPRETVTDHTRQGGAAPIVIIQNNTGERTEVKRQKGPTGEDMVIAVVGKAIQEGRLDNAYRKQYGMSPSKVIR